MITSFASTMQCPANFPPSWTVSASILSRSGSGTTSGRSDSGPWTSVRIRTISSTCLQWDDLGHRERASAAFQADKEWITARAESEAAGALISGVTRTLLRPTGFSALKLITASAYWRPARPLPT